MIGWMGDFGLLTIDEDNSRILESLSSSTTPPSSSGNAPSNSNSNSNAKQPPQQQKSTQQQQPNQPKSSQQSNQQKQQQQSNTTSSGNVPINNESGSGMAGNSSGSGTGNTDALLKKGESDNSSLSDMPLLVPVGEALSDECASVCYLETPKKEAEENALKEKERVRCFSQNRYIYILFMQK